MRTFGLFLLAAGLALAAVPAVAQETGATAFTLIAKNPEFVWANEQGQENPTLVVPAGQQVTVTVKNDADQEGFHSLQVKGQDKSEDIEDAGQTVTYTFTAPASGSVEYVCPYHATTMKGTVRVAGSAVEEKKESPGLQVVGLGLAFLGAALVLRRK
jgi:plastocyanin